LNHVLTLKAGIFRLDGTDNRYIILSVNTVPTPNLESFVDALKDIPDGERFPVTYHNIADAHAVNVAIIVNDRHWSNFYISTRNGTHFANCTAYDC
jgi:hypothetical protein